MDLPRITHTAGEISFACIYCEKVFPTHIKLKRHEKTHTMERIHSCEECGKKFQTLSILKQHSLIHTQDASHKCVICGKGFRRAENLKRHEKIHTGEKPFICPICEKAFNVKGNLTSHMQTHTGEKRFNCEKCGKKFSNSRSLKEHWLIHTGEKPHKCETCGKMFRFIHGLKRHVMKHMEDSPILHPEGIESKIKNEIFDAVNQTAEQDKNLEIKTLIAVKMEHLEDDDEQFTSHTNIQANDDEYGNVRMESLPQGAIELKNQRITDFRETAKDNDKEEDVMTSATPKQNSTRNRSKTKFIVKNITENSDRKPPVCEECGKIFSSYSNLRTHKIIHTGDKPYRCEHCGKSFNHSGTLKRHMTTHTDVMEYQYFCEVCGRGFTHKSSLKSHRTVHTWERPYVCGECGWTFKYIHILRNHMKTHKSRSEKTTFACAECGKNFTTKWNLKKHIIIHTGEKPFRCHSCGKTFNCQSRLKRHMQSSKCNKTDATKVDVPVGLYKNYGNSGYISSTSVRVNDETLTKTEDTYSTLDYEPRECDNILCKQEKPNIETCTDISST